MNAEQKEERKELALRVGEAYTKDVGRGVARISSKNMEALGLQTGDIIEIKGKTHTAAVVWRAHADDEDKDLLRMDAVIRLNAGTSLGENVSVRLANYSNAASVVIAPVENIKFTSNVDDYFKQKLLEKPLTKGDKLVFPVLGTNVHFIVQQHAPKGFVKIVEETNFKVSDVPAKITDKQKIPTVAYEDIGGLTEPIMKIREMVELPLKHPEVFERLGIGAPKGVLLYGPPGTGKTLLAKAVASECDANFVTINGPEIVSKWYGDSLPYDEKIVVLEGGVLKRKPIGEVVEKGDKEHLKVAAFDPFGKVTFAPVTDLIKHQTDSKLYEVKTKTGRNIKVTHYHSLFTLKDGKVADVKTSDLVPGESFIAVPKRLPFTEKPLERINLKELVPDKKGTKDLFGDFLELSEDFCEFLGWWVAEGSYNHESTVRISVHESEVPYMKGLLERLFGKVTIYNKKGTKGWDFYISSTHFVQVMKALGLEDGALRKKAPWIAYNLDRKRLAAFLRGYFSGDGSIFLNQRQVATIEGGTSSKELADDLMYLLLHFGIVAKMIQKEEYTGNPTYRVYFAGSEYLEKFKEIRFAQSEKNERLAFSLQDRDFLRSPQVPITSDIREVLLQHAPEFANGSTVGTRTLQKAADSGKLSEKQLQTLNTILDSDFYFDQVTSVIEHPREEFVYDISVDVTQNFIGGFGGIFAHNSEKRLRDIFQEAEKNAPTIIFIDEIDAIAPKREEVTGEVERRIVSQLLTLMDGLSSRGEVIVIAATNRPNSIDEALRRPGRFDREIEIGVPNRDERKDILQIHSRGMPLKEVNFEKIAQITHGYTGADVAALCKEAAMKALRKMLPDIKKVEGRVPSEVLMKLHVSMKNFLDAFKEISPSALREVLVETPNVLWSDIGGAESAKAELKEIIEWPLKHQDAFKRLGIKPPKGILLYGPSGCGKTLIAKAVATESEANFISVKGPELVSKWVGESEKGVREVFRRARQVSPCVVFFDEFDSIGTMRGTEEATHVGERMVNQLLTELDGMEGLEGVVVIAATNRPDLIDPALLRPGRLEKKIELNPPDEKDREAIFKVHTRNMPLAGDVSVKSLAELAENYSGADIEAVCREAAFNALREDFKAKEVRKKDFEAAIEKTKPSLLLWHAQGPSMRDRNFVR